MTFRIREMLLESMANHFCYPHHYCWPRSSRWGRMSMGNGQEILRLAGVRVKGNLVL